MQITTVAVDLAKDVFELAFADEQARIAERKRLSRNVFSKCLLNRPPLRVVMEACGSAHHWARVFQEQGRGGAGEQTGPTAVGDVPRRQTVRRRSRQCDGCAVLSPKVAGNLIQSIQFTARPLTSC